MVRPTVSVPAPLLDLIVRKSQNLPTFPEVRKLFLTSFDILYASTNMISVPCLSDPQGFWLLRSLNFLQGSRSGSGS
jgi:hypothetical protein